MAARTGQDREARRRANAYSVRREVHEGRIARRRRDDRIAVLAFVVLIAAATVSQVGFFTAGPGRPAPTPSASASASATPEVSRTLPPQSAAEDRTWTGTMTLNATKLSISLDGKEAPQAVANFVTLAQSGFYTGLTCHRLTTKGIYVLQCGDPQGDGTGGPGYTFGPLENVPKAKTVDGAEVGTYAKGELAMARGSAEDSQGSQFFIVYRTSTLPAPGYTVFGEVTGGLDALQKSVVDAGTADGGSDGAPKVATTIAGVEVR